MNLKRFAVVLSASVLSYICSLPFRNIWLSFFSGLVCLALGLYIFGRIYPDL
jgi:uncharacterized membrane protein YjjP (DUF1212 family)